MASLRDIKRRINSIRSTRQITSAMKAVAGARLRRATERAESARPYQEAMSRVLRRLAAHAGEVDEPLLQERDEIRAVDVLVFTSDRGLCGGFNNNLLRVAEQWLDEQRAAGRQLRLHTLGRKARDYFQKRGYELLDARTGLKAEDYLPTTRELVAALRADFLAGRTDEVVLYYNRFHSILLQRPERVRLLPIALQGQEPGEEAGDYDFEPEGGRILASLLPLYLETLVLQAFFENEAGEHAARMTAMDSATRNASELIDGLTLDYNRARQASITKEIIEIVSGAEAL